MDQKKILTTYLNALQIDNLVMIKQMLGMHSDIPDDIARRIIKTVIHVVKISLIELIGTEFKPVDDAEES